MLTNECVLGNNNFIVYKSSAGSGKTYTLVREYIALALKEKRPDALKHILAITFTNKAAAEMKERIVSTLHDFSIGNPQGAAALMFSDLADKNKILSQELQQRAQAALDFILHHYSDFAVSTIDKFNHKIIRTFAFDLKLPVNFDLETDTEAMMQQAVDELLAQSGKNEILTHVLLAYIEDLLQDEKSWNIGKELVQFGHQLFNEDIAQKIDAIKILSLEDFLNINKKLNAFLYAFKLQVTTIGNDALVLLKANNIEHSNLAGGAVAGIGKYFTYLANYREDKLQASNSVKKNFESGKLTSGKASAQEKIVIENISNELTHLFYKIEKLLEDQYEKYKIYKLIKTNIFSVAVLNELEKIIIELKLKNNILFISEFNKIISKAIANEPAPYIYERLGERYRHFLIDEFQDTSMMQWRNLLPLIHNALSQGFFNMIVGDTKQSIYRWRNGEVEQFVQLPEIYSKEEKTSELLELENTLVNNYQSEILKVNFRSKENIVNFNNSFFEHLCDHLPYDFSNIYKNGQQEIAKNKKGGSVNIGIFQGEGYERNDWMLNRVSENVELCLERGYKKKDIAIITRGNADGAQIAAFLMDKGIDVISKESLLLNSSAEVRFIVELVKFIDNTSNEICIAAIKYYLIHHLNFHCNAINHKNSYTSLISIFKENGVEFSIEYFKSLPLFELCTELSILFGLNQQPNAYMKFFLDQIFAFGLHRNSIAAFLQWWEIKKDKFSIIVPDGVDAVNVMTIHKSKGLQFPIVILPYADLSIITRGIKHWSSIHEPEFPELNYALLNHGELMKQTYFETIYAEEEKKIILDQLNMMYVAFTRAENHLFILSGSRKNSMHQYIQQFVEKQSFETIELKGINYLSVGMITELNHQTISVEQKQTEQWPTENKSWKSLLKTSGFMSIHEENKKQLQYGSLVHQILSEVNHSSDLDNVIMKYSNKIEQQNFNFNEIKQKLYRVIQLDALHPYFSGSYTLKKEASILDAKGQILRPDLIAINENSVSIIDYKTGEPRAEYAEQLAGYSDLLSQMGYSVKERLIVYVDAENIISI